MAYYETDVHQKFSMFYIEQPDPACYCQHFISALTCCLVASVYFLFMPTYLRW